MWMVAYTMKSLPVHKDTYFRDSEITDFKIQEFMELNGHSRTYHTFTFNIPDVREINRLD